MDPTLRRMKLPLDAENPRGGDTPTPQPHQRHLLRAPRPHTWKQRWTHKHCTPVMRSLMSLHTQNKGHTHTRWLTHLLPYPTQVHAHTQSDQQALVHAGPHTCQHRDAHTGSRTLTLAGAQTHNHEQIATHLGRRRCSPSRGGTAPCGRQCWAGDRARSGGPSRGHPRNSTRPW